MDIKFNQYIDYCYEELERKQTQFFESFNIGSYRDYHKNQDEETLVLFNNDEDKVTFNVIYIGSWSHLNNNWMWGWNNESLNI
jgi:hypothetical protein